jgi:hypothetical protein
MTTKRSQSQDPRLCHHTFADGRRCRMLRNEHPYLCPFHARQREQYREAKELQDEILSLQYRLTTAADIHHVLSKVFDALAQNQITPRMAGKLGYLCQVLLQSLAQRRIPKQVRWRS